VCDNGDKEKKNVKKSTWNVIHYYYYYYYYYYSVYTYKKTRYDIVIDAPLLHSFGKILLEIPTRWFELEKILNLNVNITLDSQRLVGTYVIYIVFINNMHYFFMATIFAFRFQRYIIQSLYYNIAWHDITNQTLNTRIIVYSSWDLAEFFNKIEHKTIFN